MNPIHGTRRRHSGAAFLMAMVLALAGCGTAESAPIHQADAAADTGPPPAAHGDHANHAEAPPAADPAEHSIYHLPGRWLDQAGRELALSDLGGRIQVMAMVYTHCSYACPRILAQMKRIEGEVAPDGSGRVGFTLVSIDPERDRPSRLREFAEKSRLDPDRWTLLNGSQEELLGLSVLLGVKYRATGQGEFSHSNVITILDDDGVIVDRVEGLNADLEPAIHTIRTMLRRGEEDDR